MTLELHAPGCPTKPCYCDPILDTYAFCRAVINDHLHVGARLANGQYTGPFHLSASDIEQLEQELVLAAWQAAQHFNGGGRLNGWVLYKLNYAVTDYKRKWLGSTRTNPRPTVELTADERHLVAEQADFTRPEILDMVNSVELAPSHRRIFQIIATAVTQYGRFDPVDYATRSGQPLSQVRRELNALRRELERKHLLAA